MITKVITFPEYKIQGLIEDTYNYSIEENWALISIYSNINFPVIKDKSDIKKLKEKNCQKILSLCFGDYTEKQYIYFTDKYKSASRHINLMTDKQAQKIVSFLKSLKRMPDIKTLIVQCKAGISRSGAIGLFACEFFGIDLNLYRLENNILPNYYIYNKLYKIK